MQEFFDWDIETGPYVSDIVDIWARIDQDMENNDISAAVAKLRRGAEQFFAEVCDNLSASVTFHLNGSHTLGELLFPAMSQFKFLLKEAKKAKASWEGVQSEDIQLLDEKRKEIFGEATSEQWAININVHYNEWVGFTRDDFSPVISAFRDLFSFFSCEKCGSILYVVKDGFKFESLRCNCDETHWNLVKKK